MIAYRISDASPKRRQQSPLEENVWLMPAGCTDIEPPEFDSSTHTCSFDGNQWIVAEIPAPEPDPLPEPISAMEQLRMQRNQLLQQTDWRMTEDYPFNDKEAWKVYRQALRDLPANSSPALDEFGNLTNIIWPEEPTNAQ